MSFELFGLPAEILEAVNHLGYTEPTEIQKQAIPMLSSGEIDFIGLAQTGTGKTCAFTLPLLQQIDFSSRHPQGIILTPTRELCQQVTGEVQKLSQFIPDIRVEAVYGGAEMHRQSTALRKGVHLIVATPGRMLDQLHRNNVKLSEVKYVVLDEADKMLEMGFEDDVRQIIESVNPERKIWLFSATMPRAIRQIAEQYMENPKEVTVGMKNTSAANISHHYYLCRPSDRMEVLQRVIDLHTDIYGLIFTRTRSDAQNVAEELIKQGYNADALHGDLPQAQRERVMKMYRERTLQLLVATDVAARGLDVQDVTHVIHYGVPDDIDTYIHRAGRTARAGKTGVSLMIATPGERSRQEQIERIIKRKFDKQIIPSAEEIAAKRMQSYVKNLIAVQPEDELILRFLPIFEEAFADISKEEIIKHLCGHELHKFMQYYKEAGDLNIAARPQDRLRDSSGSDRRDSRDARGGRDRDFGDRTPGKYTRFFINLGKKDGFDKRGFLDWLSKSTRLPVNHIHRLDLQNSFSFFETYADEAQLAEKRLSQAVFHNRVVNVSVADASSSKGGVGGGELQPAFADGRDSYSDDSGRGRSSSGRRRTSGDRKSVV